MSKTLWTIQMKEFNTGYPFNVISVCDNEESIKKIILNYCDYTREKMKENSWMVLNSSYMIEKTIMKIKSFLDTADFNNMKIGQCIDINGFMIKRCEVNSLINDLDK